MIVKFNNVYIKNTATIAGPFVKEGPFKYDKTFEDFYDGEKTFEKCEMKELENVIKILLKKENLKDEDINLLISADLLNQLTISNYTMEKFNIPFFGVYNACASMCEEILIASSFLDSKKLNKVICTTSSSNLTSERQFRNPVEYGAPKKEYQTFTVTGSTALLLTNEKTIIKVKNGCIGKVTDMGISDVCDMGAVMAPSAARTLNEYLKETNSSVDDFDLILTGDLGKYGKNIFKDYVKKEYNITLNNYDDSACMIYDKNDKNVFAGGSGISCLPLVVYSHIIPKMLNKELKKVLLLATGALMSPTTLNQKMSIPSISHAICLEVL